MPLRGEARPAVEPTTVEDRWILSRLERARAEVSSRIERYDFAHAALGLYDFVYGELCDWYLELAKPRLRDGDPALQATLLHVLTQTLALAHPIIPFVTEEIHSHVPGAQGLLAGGVESPHEWRVLFHATDADAWATLTERDAPLYEEETVEIFFDPAGDLQSYFEIEVNPLNTVLDLVLRRNRSGHVKNFAWKCEGLRTAVSKSAGAWTTELAAVNDVDAGEFTAFVANQVHQFILVFRKETD